jgi:hypothetical protein
MTRRERYSTAGLAHAAADLLTGTRLRLVMWIDSLGIVRERERLHDETVRRLNQALARIAQLEGAA